MVISVYFIHCRPITSSRVQTVGGAGVDLFDTFPQRAARGHIREERALDERPQNVEGTKTLESYLTRRS